MHPPLSSARAERQGRTSRPAPPPAAPGNKRRIRWSAAWQEARSLIWARRGRLALGLVLMLVSRLAGMVLPAMSKFFIDEVIQKGRMELLGTLALIAGAATIVQAFTSFGLSQVLGVAAQKAITDMRRRIEAHVMRLPVRYFDNTQTGVLIARVMNDPEGIRNLVGTGLVQLLGGLVTALIALVALLYINWHLTLVTLCILGAFAGAMGYAFRTLRPLFRERGRILADLTGRLSQSLGGVRVIKTYTAERREDLVFTKGAHTLFRNIAKSMTGVSGTTAFSGLVIGAIGIVMIVMGGRAIEAGTMTLGDLFAYILFTGLMAAPIVEIASIGTQISEAFAGLDRIREVLDTTREDADADTRLPIDDLRGEVAFEGVWFEYQEGVPVLRDITFTAPAGTTTALVGSSGSGKSTLISLVMAFNQPTAGVVRVDGRDLSTLRLDDYRRHLGVVLQDNFLFDGTVADNIRYGRPHATREDVERVARIAHAHGFITDFEQGYDTIVGERGVRLSGGQRQRVAIARAILADPRILLLDEATSSLDSESEAQIQDGLRRLRHGRTTFVIAHRLSTIRSAGQILVLENGAIVERGTHAELIALGGRYRQLHDRQHHVEYERFINPGEDFTPEPAPVAASTAAGASRGEGA
ncbi:MAG: ABC transporter permease [Acidobacteria bacterium SCN 69-37]|nr:MAG: ABC transporter permease [Acidobacteria bacterium SCN 69-37]